VDFVVDEGVIDAEDRDLFWFAETATEIWDGILHWREAYGAQLELRSWLHTPPLAPTLAQSAPLSAADSMLRPNRRLAAIHQEANSIGAPVFLWIWGGRRHDGQPGKDVSNFLIVHLAEVSIVKPYRIEFLVVLQAHDLVGFLAQLQKGAGRRDRNGENGEMKSPAIGRAFPSLALG
jgi:hypothetical protein